MESAKKQNSWPDLSQLDSEFRPFVPEAEAAQETQPVIVAAAAESPSVFQHPTGFWEAMTQDPLVKADMDRVVEERVRQRLQSEFETLKQGYLEEGRQEGIRQGLEQAAADIQTLTANVQEICESILREKQELIHSHEKIWAQTLRHLLNRFLISNATPKADQIERWLMDATTEFAARGKIRVRLSPELFEQMETLSSHQSPEERARWEFIKDATLKKGEIHCECAEGGVFFSPDAQFRLLDEKIEKEIV